MRQEQTQVGYQNEWKSTTAFKDLWKGWYHWPSHQELQRFMSHVEVLACPHVACQGNGSRHCLWHVQGVCRRKSSSRRVENWEASQLSLFQRTTRPTDDALSSTATSVSGRWKVPSINPAAQEKTSDVNLFKQWPFCALEVAKSSKRLPVIKSRFQPQKWCHFMIVWQLDTTLDTPRCLHSYSQWWFKDLCSLWEKCYWVCMECKGPDGKKGDAMHKNPQKEGSQIGEKVTCFYHHHNRAFFGLAKNAHKLLGIQRKKEWAFPWKEKVSQHWSAVKRILQPTSPPGFSTTTAPSTRGRDARSTEAATNREETFGNDINRGDNQRRIFWLTKLF